MRYQLLSFSCALIGGYWLQAVTASCYYPDGSFPEDYVYTECSGDGISSCCIQDNGMQCLSNGLCFSEASNYMYRGGCSDKSWKDESCFQHCRGTSDTFSSSTWEEIVSCGDGKYCCYSDSPGSTCCNDDSKVFTVDSGSVVKELSGTATDALPIATTTKTSTSAPTSKPTNTPTATSAPSTPPTSTHIFSKNAIIGLAAGGTALLFLAIFLVFFFVRRRYRKKLTSTSTQSIPLSSNGFQKLQDKPELDSHQLLDKSPRPVEVPAPMHSPAPPYQPPQYGPQQGLVEIGGGYRGPERNQWTLDRDQWGQPVFEVPAEPYRGR